MSNNLGPEPKISDEESQQQKQPQENLVEPITSGDQKEKLGELPAEEKKPELGLDAILNNDIQIAINFNPADDKPPEKADEKAVPPSEKKIIQSEQKPTEDPKNDIQKQLAELDELVKKLNKELENNPDPEKGMRRFRTLKVFEEGIWM